jgi:hypothetical protein
MKFAEVLYSLIFLISDRAVGRRVWLQKEVVGQDFDISPFHQWKDLQVFGLELVTLRFYPV